MKTARAEQARAPLTTTTLQPWAFWGLCAWSQKTRLCGHHRWVPEPDGNTTRAWFSPWVPANFHTTLMKPVPKSCALCHCPAEGGFALGQNPGLLSKGPLPASPRLGAGSHWVLPVPGWADGQLQLCSFTCRPLYLSRVHGRSFVPMINGGIKDI